MDAKELLKESGLDWTVRTENVQTVSGILLPDKIAIIRNDNDMPLGDHKSGYKPYQNHELMDLLFKISQKTGLELHTGGSFRDGKRVFVQLKSDDLTLNGDKIEGFISGINSFDGSTSLSFGTSTLTMSCSNVFWRIYRSMQTKMRHTESMFIKIDEILKNIDHLVEEEKEQFKTIQHLAEVEMSPEVKEMVVRKLFDLTREEMLDVDSISTNKTNKMIRFYSDLDTEIKSKDNTLWGLFSGVTRYTTHSMKKTDNTESKIFGRIGQKEREIWETLSELV